MSRKKARSGRRFGYAASSLQLTTLLARPFLLNLTDLILLVLLTVLPFVMGGREAPGHWLLISGSLLLGGVWCLYCGFSGGRLRLTALEPLLLLGLLLVWGQTRELTSEQLQQLSPTTAYLTPAWADSQLETAAESWSTISFYPSETQHAFLMLLAYGVFGLVLAQRLRREQDCYLLLRLIGISGLAMACFAILQLLLTNGNFFWFYEHPYTDTREVLKGAFTNRNHFAQYLSLAVAALLWWALSRRKDTTLRHIPGLSARTRDASSTVIPAQVLTPGTVMLIASAAILLVCTMLSLSRGGMVSTVCVCALIFLLLWRQRQGSAGLAISLLLLGGLAIGAIILPGGDEFEQRVSQLASLDADVIDALNGRRSIWDADLRAIREFPWLGTGIGTQRFVYGIYMENLADFSEFTFTHAESTYINLALEAGLAGLGLLALGLFLTVVRLLKFVLCHQNERSAAAAAALAALLGGMAHASADFIWYVPAVVITTTAFVMTGIRLSQGFAEDGGLPCPRLIWMACGVGCLLLLGMVQPELSRRMQSEHYYYRYLTAEKNSREVQEAVEDHAFSESETLVSAVDPMWDRIEQSAPDSVADYAADAGSSESEEAAEEELPELAAEVDEVQHLRDQLTLLINAWKADPRNAEVCLRISYRSLRLFELLQTDAANPYKLIEIRDVVKSSGFADSAAARDFLNRAVGNNLRLALLADSMARRSLALCPLLPEAYRQLIQTGFLQHHEDPLRPRMIAQAMRLGKYDPDTRFAVGRALFLDDRPEQAMQQWKLVFHSNSSQRKRLLKVLAGNFSVNILTEFEPTLLEAADVLSAYMEAGRPEDHVQLIDFVIAQTEFLHPWDGEEVQEEMDFVHEHEQYLDVVMLAYRMAYQLQDSKRSELLLRRAITCNTTAEAPRRGLGLLMMEQQRYAEAESLFMQCYELSPGDVKLEELRRECRRLRQTQNRQLRNVTFGESEPIVTP